MIVVAVDEIGDVARAWSDAVGAALVPGAAALLVTSDRMAASVALVASGTTSLGPLERGPCAAAPGKELPFWPPRARSARRRHAAPGLRSVLDAPRHGRPRSGRAHPDLTRFRSVRLCSGISPRSARFPPFDYARESACNHSRFLNSIPAPITAAIAGRRSSSSSASLALVFALGGCSKAYIPNTDVEDTGDNRKIVHFCEEYRHAVEDKNIGKLLALASPRYHEDGGNTCAARTTSTTTGSKSTSRASS